MLNHNYIGTEHILLGLVHEGEGLAAQALVSLSISLEAVREQVEQIVGQGGAIPTGHIPFTPRAKKVMELSLREALQLGHKHIGTEHLLLGLVREGEGVAAQVLQVLGADLDRVRRTVVELLSGLSPVETVEVREGPESRSGRVAEVEYAEGVPTGEAPTEPPRCPWCRTSLTSSVSYRVITAVPVEGDETREVAVFFCQVCGRSLGTLN